jgi:hypothetical protein
MTRIRRFAIVLLTASVVTSAIYATGAFTNITATRDANIQVAGDAAGYLAIKPAQGSNGAYASLRGGKLRVSVGSALDGKGGGVNKNAITAVRNIFTITNKGSQPVGIWLTDASKAVTFRGGTKWKALEGRKNAVALNPGETLYVGLTVDTRGKTKGDLINSMKIHANAEVSGANVKTGPSKPARDNNGAATSTGSPGSPSNKDGSSSNSKGDKSDSKSSKKDKSKSGDSKSDSASQNDRSTLDRIVYAAKALSGGFFIGDWGMPGMPLAMKESSSPLFLIGQLLNAIAPGPLDVAADLRDLVAKAVSGDLLSMGALFNAIGLLPVFGAVDDVRDLSKTIDKWTSAFPSKADEVVGVLKKAFIKYLPDWAGGKLLGMVSDAPVSKLRDADIPMDDIMKYQDEVDMQRVLDLRKKDVSPEDIRYYVENDIDLGLVSRLRDEGMNPQRIRFRLGDGSKKSISTLRGQGLTRTDIVHLIDEGADLKKASKLRAEGVSTANIKTLAEEGADLRQAKKALSRDITIDDIKYYAREEIKISSVNKLRYMRVSPKHIKSILTFMKNADVAQTLSIKEDKIGYKNENIEFSVDISNKKLQWINRRIEGDHKFSEKVILIAASTVNYNSWKGAKKSGKQKKKATQDARKQKQGQSSRRSIRKHLGTPI